MSNVVFFESDPSIHKADPASINIGIGLQNQNLENWLIQELTKMEVSVDRRVLLPQEENLSGLDALVLLRKNKSGGIDNPVSIAKEYVQLNPRGLVLFIAGTLDDRGSEQVRELKSIVPKLYVASVTTGTMGSEVVERKLSEMIHEWKKSKSKTYLVRGAKGGCGVTTLVSHLANELAKSSNVAVIERRDSLKYHALNTKIQPILRTSINYEDLASLKEKHDYVILDDVAVSDQALINQIIVIDGSPESIERAKAMKPDIVVLNHACLTALPTEVIESELGKPIRLAVQNDREKFIRASITGEAVIEDIEKLL